MHDARGGRWRTAIANLSLSLASLVVSVVLVFAVGEGFFRIKFGSAVEKSNQTSFYEFDQQRGWRLRPGEYSQFNFGSHRVVSISINEWGMRERPVAANVPAGKKRISIVGDSFVFAEALSASKRFTGKLQELAGSNYEVVNISVPGYGTGQQFRMLEDLVSRGFQLGSKVILVFFTNDIQDNLGLVYSSLKIDPQRPRFQIDENRSLRSVGPQEKRSGQNRRSFLNRSLFYNYMKKRLEVLASRFPRIFVILDNFGLAPSIPRTPGIIAGWYGTGWEERWSATQDILGYIANHLRTKHKETEFEIAFVPSPLQIEKVLQVMISRNLDADPRYSMYLNDIDRPQRKLRIFAEEQGIPFIDMTAPLRKAGGSYFPSEGHLNEVGSEIAAQVLYQNAFERK